MRGLPLLLAAPSTILAGASFINKTIDDASAVGVSYFGGGWLTQLSGGLAQPDREHVYGGTWHDNTRSGNNTVSDRRYVEVKFTGVALYIFCILYEGPWDTITTQTNLTFTLDGSPAGTYKNDPKLKDFTYTYDVQVFAVQNLQDMEHTFIMDIEWNSVVLLDSIVYTRDELPAKTSLSSTPTLPPSSKTSGLFEVETGSSGADPVTSPKSTVNLGTAIGSTIGGMALIASIVVLLLYRRHKGRIVRLKAQQLTLEIEPRPFSLPPSSLLLPSPLSTQTLSSPQSISQGSFSPASHYINPPSPVVVVPWYSNGVLTSTDGPWNLLSGTRAQGGAKVVPTPLNRHHEKNKRLADVERATGSNPMRVVGKHPSTPVPPPPYADNRIRR